MPYKLEQICMKNNSIYKSLREFGLTEKEIVVYLQCLKVVDATPFTISKATGIARTTVYDILLGLSLKGLITVTQSDGYKKQQTKVRAKDPFVIRKILSEKRSKLYELEADIVQFLPYIKKEFLSNSVSPHIEFFDGIEGMRKVYWGDNKLIGKYEVCAFENLMPIDVMPSAEINEEIDVSSKKYKNSRFRPRYLIVLNDWSRHVLSYQCERDPNYLEIRDFRYIEDIGLEIKSNVVIAGNYIRISTASGDESWGAIINSKALKETLMTFFNFVWIIAKPVTKDFVKSFGRNKLLEAQIANERTNEQTDKRTNE